MCFLTHSRISLIFIPRNVLFPGSILIFNFIPTFDLLKNFHLFFFKRCLWEWFFSFLFIFFYYFHIIFCSLFYYMYHILVIKIKYSFHSLRLVFSCIYEWFCKEMLQFTKIISNNIKIDIGVKERMQTMHFFLNKKQLKRKNWLYDLYYMKNLRTYGQCCEHQPNIMYVLFCRCLLIYYTYIKY